MDEKSTNEQDGSAIVKAIATDLLEEHGRTAIARMLRVRPTSTYKWDATGIPPRKVLDLARALNYERTPHQIRPDLYPHPDDGLPEHLRGKAS